MDVLELEVIDLDIQNGERGLCSSCPIALAALRKYPDCSPAVDCDDIALYINGERTSFTLPPEASAFVDNFDSGRIVAPFKFSATPADDLDDDDDDDDLEFEDDDDDLDDEEYDELDDPSYDRNNPAL